MALDDDPDKLSGTIEADETYMGGRRRRGHNLYHERVKDEIEMGIRRKPPYQEKTAVFGMVERDGEVRSMVVPKATGRYLKPIMTEMINLQDSELMTDGSPIYKGMGEHLPHGVINHELAYVAGDIHTQNIEGYWSILKRGVYGVFHHVGDGYLPMYLSEFDFRFNARRVSDSERFQLLMSQVSGKRVLWFCQTEQPSNPHA